MFRYTLFKALGAAAINGGIVYTGLRQHLQNYQWYKNLPLEKQQAVYNNCPLQKMSYSVDFFSALQEKIDTLNLDRHKDILPKKPFDDQLKTMKK